MANFHPDMYAWLCDHFADEDKQEKVEQLMAYLGAASTIDRIIDSFPSTQQAQIRTQLSAALSREDILSAVWGREYEGELKIVDVNIRRLRIKIEDDTANPTYITTVWGFGYKWGA